MNSINNPNAISRRTLLAGATTAFATVSMQQADSSKTSADSRNLSIFQHACMTLPYSNFPLDRALKGIKAAGFRYVAWGVKHRQTNGELAPVMAEDASPESARILGDRCRDIGLEPAQRPGLWPRLRRD